MGLYLGECPERSFSPILGKVLVKKSRGKFNSFCGVLGCIFQLKFFEKKLEGFSHV